MGIVMYFLIFRVWGWLLRSYLIIGLVHSHLVDYCSYYQYFLRIWELVNPFMVVPYSNIIYIYIMHI